MTFQAADDNFLLNGEKIFLNSGEIHYFRVRRELWATHLEAAREAGLDTISSYVPWAWHEYEEGTFDFNGTSLPERDLAGWLELCQSYGLTCIVKPGPFILAEFRGAGLPDWFMERYREVVKMRNSRGDIVASDGVSLFHPVYLEKVTLWYDQIMPLIGRFESEAGGPVIMMQICNEIGVFAWLARQGDYCPEVHQRFIAWLQKNYSNIDEINTLWGTGYQSFHEAELPPDGNLAYQSPGDRARDNDWHRFWRSYYGDYLRMLSRMARERGITVPFYHNLPGWIYGHGYEFPVNITMYDDLFGDKSELIFGVDHIPEFLSHRNMHDDRIINDITHAMQGNKPLFAAEFQCGSREYHVVTNPAEMELFYKASIAHGLKGWNYYMFSQGRNVPGKGYSGDTFYWFNPLTAEGERTSAFPLVKRMSRILKNTETIIVNARRRAEVCVLFYPPYYATELERPVDGNCKLLFTPSAIRRPAYFDGLLKVLQVLNIDYDLVDVRQATAEKLSAYRQTWLFSTDEMNAPDQQTVVDYMNGGGQCVIFPSLPHREMSQQPCTLIRDAVDVTPAGTELIDSPLVEVLQYRDIKCANPFIVYDESSLEGATVVARTLHGSVCGFMKPVGRGSVLHLGTWLGFDTEGHKPVYEALLLCSDARLRNSSADSDWVTVSERFTDDGRAMLFAGNYYNEEQKGSMTYTHPASGDPINLPYTCKTMNWPPLYAILTPVGVPVAPGITLLHSTSDLLGMDTDPESVVFTLQGHRDLMGELVLEGEGVQRLTGAVCQDQEVKIVRDHHRIAFIYHHKHHDSIVLKVEFA